ncbi:MAG: type II secretion system protein GspK, partial [Campylobacterota bacterium]|nr:type II secretion system protein GspK [Campylobacterota bacterium]
STSLKNNLLLDTAYPLPSEMIVDGREYNITKNLSISLRDSSSMLNIKFATSELVAYALTSKNREDLVSILKDSLADWRDTDNFARVNGAEQSRYKEVSVRDSRAIQDIHELKLIQGFDKIDIETIKENFYYGRGSSPNLMLIKNRRYLAHLLQTDEPFMENMLELRQNEPLKFTKNLHHLPGFNDDYMGSWLSRQFLIRIRAKKERAQTIITAIISFKQLENRPYITVSFIMN